MIFCVEDDNSIRELMLYTMKSQGFETCGFPDSASFWEGMRGEKPELIILDIMLPDEDGTEILKKLRSHVVTKDIPVIMATAKGTEYDKVIGLDLGADDYLVKPFGMMEMISRIKALLRRTRHQSTKTILRSGDLEMNETKHEVSVCGQTVILTLKEYEVLRLFLHNPGKVFTREMLISLVWESEYAGETRTVDVHIGSLRTKIGDAGNCIKTVRGVGYRWEETE